LPRVHSQVRGGRDAQARSGVSRPSKLGKVTESVDLEAILRCAAIPTEIADRRFLLAPHGEQSSRRALRLTPARPAKLRADARTRKTSRLCIDRHWPSPGETYPTLRGCSLGWPNVIAARATATICRSSIGKCALICAKTGCRPSLQNAAGKVERIREPQIGLHQMMAASVSAAAPSGDKHARRT
jgi:hypothetical protein